MSSKLSDTIETAKETLDSAKDGAKHAQQNVRSGVHDAVGAIRGMFSSLREFNVDEMLSWVGLARQRSAARSVAYFGAGVFVGASAALVLAPTSGADTRRAIAKWAKQVGVAAREAWGEAEAEVAKIAPPWATNYMNSDDETPTSAGDTDGANNRNDHPSMR